MTMNGVGLSMLCVGLSAMTASAFTLLRLAGLIRWPWLWVVSPIWIMWLLMAVAIAGVALAAFFRAHPIRRASRRARRGE